MSSRDNRDSSLKGVKHTRTSSVWTATAVAALLLLVLVIFIAQNGERTRIHFFWGTWTTSLAVGLLLAAVLGALIVLLVGVLRVAQLRLANRRHLRGHDGPAGVDTAAEVPHREPISER